MNRTAASRTWPLLVTLMCAACWDRPLSERVTLEFREDQAVTARVETTLRWPEPEKQPAATARLEQRAREIVEGRSPWADPFARVAGLQERFEWLREDRHVIRATHEVTVAEAGALAPLLRACGADLGLAIVRDERRLTIFAVGRSRASEKERRDVEAELAPWAAALAQYGRDVEQLVRHVEDHPARARAVFGNVFEDLLPPEQREALPEPTDDEQALITAYGKSAGAVTEVGQLDPQTGTTFDERVRAAYSPFCGEIVVTLPAEPIEVEGFVRRTDKLAIPRADLFTLLTGGELSPVSPDPLATQLRNELNDEHPPFDLAAWLAQPRTRNAAETEIELLRRVKLALAPAERYSVAWRQAPTE